MIVFHNAILVKPEKIESKAGEMAIPQSDAVSQIGIVEEIGSEVDTNIIKSGDKVVYYKHTLTEIDIYGEKKYVLDFDDVIAKL